MSINNIFRKKQNGQGLVETLIAVSVSVIVVTSLVSLAVFALRNSRQSSYTAQATQIARNQLERLRAYRDSSTTTWLAFVNNLSGASGAANCGGTLPTACGSAVPGNVCSYGSSASLGSAPVSGATSSVTPFTYYFTLSCTSGTCNSSGGTVRANVYVSWSVAGKTQCVFNYTDFTNWRGR